MTNLQQLLEREKKVKDAQKKLRSKIKREEEKEKVRRYTAFGLGMAEIFNEDPACMNSDKISALCARYLGNQVSGLTVPPAGSEFTENLRDE